jgi:hypothetical protein
MTSLQQSFLSSTDKNTLTRLVNILQKCGNKQRALSYLFSLFGKLKLGLAGFPIVPNYPLHTLDEKNPIQIIQKSLYNLKPAFFIRRTIRSGRRYDLPVPISDKRATFMAIDWLRKTVFKDNKNDKSFTSLLAREISATLYHEGSAKDFLKAYIDIALDQRPFGRFIKPRKYTVSKSQRTLIAGRFEKMHKIMGQRLGARQYHNKGITRRLNIHNYRVSLVKARKSKLSQAKAKKIKAKTKKLSKRIKS